MSYLFLDTTLISGLLLALLAPSWTSSQPEHSESVRFNTSDGGTIQGTLFPAGKELAVVLAHGAVFNKESWYPIAENLQAAGTSALAIDFRGYGESTAADSSARDLDIDGAIAFLEGKGYGAVALVGGSMGGNAVLVALSHNHDTQVVKAVILASAGPAIRQTGIKKLFIVSKGDPIAAQTTACYEASASPKEMKVFSGSAHAQHLFKTEHAAELTKIIVTFLSNH